MSKPTFIIDAGAGEDKSTGSNMSLNLKKAYILKRKLEMFGWKDVGVRLGKPPKFVDLLYLDSFADWRKYKNTRCYFKNLVKDSILSISDKSLLYHNLGKIDSHIRDTFMMRQIDVNITDSSSIEACEKLFDGRMWIFKPVAGWSGKGIQVFNSYNGFKEYAESIDVENWKFFKSKSSRASIWVLSEYIENPLLIDGHKFHLRLYFTVYKNTKGVKSFLHNTGIIMVSKFKYDLSSSDIVIHSVHSDDSEKHEFPREYIKYFTEKNAKKLHNDLLKIFKAVSKIDFMECFEESKKCFYDFGCDVMITDKYETKLIEINDKAGISSFITIDKFGKCYVPNLMKLIFDPVFFPKLTNPEKKIRYTDTDYTLISVGEGGDVNKSTTKTFTVYLYNTDTGFQKHSIDYFNRYGWTHIPISRNMKGHINYLDYSLDHWRYFQNVTSDIRSSADPSRKRWKDKSSLYNVLGSTPRGKLIRDKFMMKQYDVDSNNIMGESKQSEKFKEFKNIFDGRKYILKPITGWKGLGIKITASHNEALKHFNQTNQMDWIYHKDKQSESTKWVIAEYIDNPLLIQGCKFHIRAYFMVYLDSGFKTGATPKIKGYLFKTGIIMQAIKKYRPSNYDDDQVHNIHAGNSIKKIYPNTFIKEFGLATTNKINTNMQEYFIELFNIINTGCYPETKNCFTLYGADIMFDASFNVKILEINSSIGRKSLSEKKEAYEFMNNIFSICIVPNYGKPAKWKDLKAYWVIGEKCIDDKKSAGSIGKISGSERQKTYLIDLKVKDSKPFEKQLTKYLDDNGWVNHLDLFAPDDGIDHTVGLLIHKKYDWKSYDKYKSTIHASTENERSITNKSAIYDISGIKKYMMPQYTIDSRNSDDLERVKKYFTGKIRFIVKPMMGSIGMGIFIANTHQALLKNLGSSHVVIYDMYKKSADVYRWILAEYIENPLLLKGRKFHIRVFYLVTVINGVIRAYIYGKNYIMYATKKYNKTSTDILVHNIHSDNSSKCVFPKCYTDEFGQAKTDKLIKDLKDIFTIIFKVYKSKCYDSSDHCYNVFGADIMVTDKYETKIIELNQEPGKKYLSESTELFDHYTQNLQELVINPVFGPPTTEWKDKHSYVQVGGPKLSNGKSSSSQIGGDRDASDASDASDDETKKQIYEGEKHTFAVESDYFAPYLNKKIIELGAGMWEEFSLSSSARQGDQKISFLYMDNLSLPWKKYKNTHATVKNVVDNTKYSIADKANLYQNLAGPVRKKFMPLQYTIDLGTEPDGFTKWCECNCEKYRKIIKHDMWMLKPVTGYKGIGIKMVDNFGDFKRHLREHRQEDHAHGSERSKRVGVWVLSKYIDPPLLFKGHKFHIRLYYLVSQIEGKVHGYIFKSGHLYISKKKYKMSSHSTDIHNLHLDNSNIDLFPESYAKEFGVDACVKLYTEIYKMFQGVFDITKIGCFDDSSNCYYIYGADIMVTEDGCPKLLEVNTSPHLGVMNINKTLANRYVTNIFSLVLNPIFGEPPGFPKNNDYILIGEK